MRPDKCVLRDFLGVLLIAQQLVHHGITPIPVTGNHFVERRLVTVFEAKHEGVI